MTIRQFMMRSRRIGGSVKEHRYWKDMAKMVSPEQWLAMVERLPGYVRAHAACVIWWDFFGGRVIADRWDQLDRFVKEYDHDNPADRSALIHALTKCGYPKTLAVKRCQQNLWQAV